MVAIILMILTIIVLGFLYLRMIKRDTSQIGKMQAWVPVALGVVSTPLSFAVFIGLGSLVVKAGGIKGLPLFIGSFVSAFVGAGFGEELAKMLMIVLAAYLFRKKLNNVYEYMLIGFAVGFGFSIFEEFLYGSDGASSIFRMLLITLHCLFGICMTMHLGYAKYNKAHGTGLVGREYVLAFVIPCFMHTLFDAATSNNKMMVSSDDQTQIVGVTFALIVVAVMFVLQIVLLVRLKKNAGKYCDMIFEVPDTQE